MGGSIELLSLSTDIQSLFVDHVNIEKEREVVVGIWMLVIEEDASFEMFHCVLVVSNLEIGKTQIVVQLSVIILNPLRLLEGGNGQHVLVLLVHGDAVVEEGLPRRGVILLQVSLAFNGQAIPVTLV